MDIKDLRGLTEAYFQVHSAQEIDEATAMAKRGHDETAIRQKIAKSTGGGAAADRATKLENRPTYGDANKAKQRSDYARKQRGDFRNTTSSNPGLHGYGHQSNDPKVKAKQAARGAQRGSAALTPAEKKQLNREEFDIFDTVLEFLYVEGYVETLEEAEWMMANELEIEDIVEILEAAGSYGETPKAYSAASKTKMTAKRKPFLKAMLRRTNPAERRDSASPRKGMTASDREEARAGAAYGSPRGHDYPSQGPGGVTKNPKKLRKQKAMGEFAKEDFELWVNELVEEGYNLSDYTWDEMYEFYLDEAIYSEKGKAKAAEMIAKRSTPSGRAKSGKGANVAQIRQISGSGRGRFDREGLGGTPMTPTMAKNPIKKQNYDGTGNKAARRVAALKNEDFDIFDTVLEFLCAEGYVETLEEAEGSYGETPKAYAAASKTKMTAKRKPFLKAMQRRTNPANRKDAYASPRKGLTADDRERARAGSAHGVGTRADHDYPSQGPGGVTKNPKKLRKQKAMGEFAKEDFEEWFNEAMTNYEKNRKRAAQRAAARNAARDQGKTGAVPGVGYVTPRRERETWTDESGKTRHAKGL